MGNILTQVLDYLGVKHTRAYADEVYSSQPFRDSMYGLSVMLGKYHVANRCVRLSDKEAIRNMVFPVVNVISGRYFICTGIKEDRISLVDVSGKTFEMPLSDFIEKWSGITLTVRRTPHSIEPDYVRHHKEQRLSQIKNFLLAACAAVLLAAGIAWNSLRGQWWWYAVMLIDLAGIGVGYLLLQKELHIDNGFTDRLCGLIKESHCEDVTESDAASFFGLAKMSEIGAGFFGVNLLALLFFPGVVSAMAIVAVAVLPFTFWSVWYQKFRARSWCVLCLSTLALMWLQAGALWVGGAFGYYAGVAALVSSLIVLIAAYGLTVLALGRVVKTLATARERDMWRQQFNTLKADEKVVEAFEHDAPEFGVTTDECSGLMFGNPDAERRITVFSNPYCGPCAMMHERIKDMPAEDCCVQYVLTYFSDDLSDVNRYIIAAYQQLGPKRAWKIMTEWYAGDKSRSTDFFKNYELDINTSDVSAEFDKHLQWRDGKPLAGTPTVLMNGREIMAPLMVEDYVYMPQKSA
ncbi:MAG: thioredoxin domain-containing protein [Muribaculaceae bacterium]|nr:thioredoxin domain-containing protein [Muribaculaceae bacterium]MDE6610751.1 thioredoxin domain-containing protein [Muribaculaceae bacterium]